MKARTADSCDQTFDECTEQEKVEGLSALCLKTAQELDLMIMHRAGTVTTDAEDNITRTHELMMNMSKAITGSQMDGEFYFTLM